MVMRANEGGILPGGQSDEEETSGGSEDQTGQQTEGQRDAGQEINENEPRQSQMTNSRRRRQ